MVLKETLKTIEDIAKAEGLSQPYVVGGMPRDKVLNHITSVPDIDITTGDSDSYYLARAIADKMGISEEDFTKFDDGHIQLIISPFKADFSSNFKVPGIRMMLKKAGISKPTSMQEELYSRDFTCNAMLLSMDLGKVLDPIGLGMPDIEKKMLRTCLPAKITFEESPNRVVRVFYLAAKLGFSVDEEIREWIANNVNIIEKIDDKYFIKKMSQALQHDAKRTVSLLDSMKLWKHIPYTEAFAPYMSKHVERI